MTILPTNKGVDFARVLSALGQGLMGAGQQGWGAFGPGVMQGAAFYDQGIDRERQRELDDLTAEVRRQQLEDARNANTEAAEAKRRRDAWLAGIAGGGPMAPNNGRPGGMAPQAGPMSGQWSPEQIAYFQANPDAASEIIGQQLFQKAADDKPTDDLREYEFAKSQGYRGTFFEYQNDLRRAGAGSTSTTIYNKDYGAIPPGHRLVEGPEGVRLEALPVENLPGSPEAVKAGKAADIQAQTADIVTTDVQRALENIKSSPMTTTGIGGAIMQNIPGTTAFNTRELASTIKANTSFDKLQAMRESSPTGGALGPVSDVENKKLEDAVGALSLAQSREQIEYNLKRVYNTYMDIIHGEGKGPQRYNLDQPAGPSGGSQLKSKYGLE